ncbi:nose resistant to fluoxetine protein 6-like [Phthorimaea operculella]|nr:nose resistant to fluoxetine protein 6-like [Phthorimaea operculella]
MWLAIVILVIIGQVFGDEAKDIEDQRHHLHLPQYTQLDDYDKCLSNKNGLYCLGSFRIHPNHGNNETYRFIKEYSDQKYRYNRTLFHRGYCVSTNCPPHSDPEKRFEKCVQEWASKENLNATLEELHYCKTPKKTVVLISSAQAFILTIFFLLILNLVGTITDLKTEADTKDKFWTGWSIKSNWKKLMEPFGNDPDRTALAPIQILRVILMAIIIVLHVVCMQVEAFIDSPLWIEKMMLSPGRILYFKGISSVQVFYVVSSFLSSYNLLLLTKKQKIGLWMLPKQFLKRYFRIAPLHILVTWFAATWWRHVSDGPMWSKIEAETAICKRKLWTHVLHVHNIVEGEQFCLPQTWYLAVDLHYQLICLFLTVVLAQYKLPKFKILFGLFISACLFNGSLAYLFRWKPNLQIANDINIADSIHVEYTFTVFYYFSTWGSLPSCLVGLIIGHVYFKIRQEGLQVYKNKWLRIICRCSLPFLVLWISAGWWTHDWKDRVVMAISIAIERPMFCIPPALWLFGVISGVRIWPGFKRLTGRIWVPLGRLSLAVLLLHWIVIETRLSSQAQPVVVNWTTLFTEFLVAWCLSYTLAVPLTLLVEMPIINTYEYVSKMDFKLHLRYKRLANKILQQKQD